MSTTNNATDGADMATGLVAAIAADQAEAEEVVEPNETETVEQEEDKKAEEEPEVEPEEKPEAGEEEEPGEGQNSEEEPESSDTDKWKALSRKNENKLKASLSKNQELEKKNQALELEKVKYELAISKGFSLDDIIFLDGDSKESIEAKAEALAKRFESSKPATGFGFNPLAGVGGRNEKPQDRSPEGIIGAALSEFNQNN